MWVDTNDTGVESVCIIFSLDKDIMVLTMAIANKYEARRRWEREHRVHSYIAEKFLTYGTFAALQDLSKYPNKFILMYHISIL
jgi:hypothetical protein